MNPPEPQPSQQTDHWPLQAVDIAGRPVEFVDFAGPAPDAPCLLLLHGGNCTSEDWQPLVPALREHFRIVATDAFVHPIQPWDAWQLLDHLGVHNVTLLPHSAGSRIAVPMYRYCPQRICAIVSVDAGVAGQMPLARKMPHDAFTDEAKAMYEQKRDRMAQLRPHHQGDYPSDVTIDRRMVAYQRESLSPEQRAATRPAPDPVVRIPDAPPPGMIADEGRYITCPLLLIVTGRSKLRPDDPAIRDCLAQLQATDVTFELFEHFGHWPWLENRRAFLDVVIPFVLRHAR